MNQEFPTLNGIAPSWADLKTTVTPDGGSLIDTFDYAALTFSSTVEIGAQKGASGGRVMRSTTGDQSHDGSITYYRSGLRKLLKGLIPIAPQRGNQRLVSLVHQTIMVQHSVPGDPEIYEVKLKGVRLRGFSWTMAEGNEADKVEVPVFITEIAQLIDGAEVVLL